MISDKDYEEINRRSKVDHWDVLFTMIGTVGEPCLVSAVPNYAIKNIGLFKNKTEVHGKYLYYYLCSPEAQHHTKSHSRGTTQQYIPLGALRKFPVRYPEDENEMRAIAHILGSLDDKIELNRRMNETLEGMAQALFKSWFTDFDPVIDNALAAGNPIPEEFADRAEIRRQTLSDFPDLGKTAAKFSNVRKLFPASFIETDEMGWIPEGWEIGKISDLAELNSESWNNKCQPEYIKYIDLANTKNGRINEVFPYVYSEAPSRARRILRADDTIIGTVRPGNRSFAYIHEDGLTGSTGFAVLRPKEKNARSFIYLCLTQDEVIDNFAHLADGGAYPAIRPEVVGNRETVLFDAELMKFFDEQCHPMIEKIGQHQREVETLTKLRDTLLPKLISGELRIQDAEKMVGESEPEGFE